jgi:hypothetical protein
LFPFCSMFCSKILIFLFPKLYNFIPCLWFNFVSSVVMICSADVIFLFFTAIICYVD